MIRNTLGLAAVLALSSLAACGDRLTGPSDDFARTETMDMHTGDTRDDAIRLTVMTRNLFVGTDVDRLIGITDPNQIPFIVADLWQLLLANAAEDRMAAVAREIAAHRPHLVGLQEVSTFRVQHPADFQLNAETVVIDFIPSLLAELAALGADYRVVAQVKNMDVELPRLNPDFSLTDVRVTDFDVILARADTDTAMPFAANYAASWFLAPGVEIPRGLAAVDATIDGETFRFVNTHPEPVETQGGAVQSLQASELVGLLTPESRPTILLGDLNTEAGSGDTYGMLVGTGFLDVFDLRRPSGAGDLTCCHSVDLSSDAVPLIKRIDHVMVRNFDALWPSAGRPPVDVRVLGDGQAEKSDGGLWPSDHAGVVATFVLPRPGG
jgi:hypothetical protein